MNARSTEVACFVLAGIAVIAGCTAAPVTPHSPVPHSPASVTSPAPAISPASASAQPIATTVSEKVTGICVPGYAPDATGSFISLDNELPSDLSNSGFGYSLTLTNNSPETVEVTGFAVAFRSSFTHVETGDSVESSGIDAYILPGQSWTWTEYPWSNNSGYPAANEYPPFWLDAADGNYGPVDRNATCETRHMEIRDAKMNDANQHAPIAWGYTAGHPERSVRPSARPANPYRGLTDSEVIDAAKDLYRKLQSTPRWSKDNDALIRQWGLVCTELGTRGLTDPVTGLE